MNGRRGRVSGERGSRSANSFYPRCKGNSGELRNYVHSVSTKELCGVFPCCCDDQRWQRSGYEVLRNFPSTGRDEPVSFLPTTPDGDFTETCSNAGSQTR